MVLPVMESERLRGDMGLEGIGRVGKIRQLMLHGILLCFSHPSIGLFLG
jgi:hypothetical protein